MIKKFRLFFLLLTLYHSVVSASVLLDLEGKPVDFQKYRGKWIVLNYWANWCPPCRKEIPELNHFYQAHRDRDAVIIGVHYDPLSSQELKTWVKKLNIHYPVLEDDPSQQLGISIVGLPTTYLIDPNGKLQPPLLGGVTKEILEKSMVH